MDRAVVEYLANAFWQVPLLVAGIAALLWALGAGVRARHRAWLAVLAVALVLPLRGMDFSSEPAPAPHLYKAIQPPAAAVPLAETVVARPLPPAGRSKPMLVFGEVSGRWLVRLYLAVSVFFAWRILHSWIAARGLLRRSRSIDLAPRAMAILAQVAEGQGVPLPRLRQSDETISPVVIGAVRPVLLLPAGFDRLKDDEVRAALSHEFAHLSRRDYLINLLCQVFALPLAWHPAIHYVHRRIRDTREMLCDAVAAEEMASPVRYATCLVAFALRALDGHDAALATQGVSMFDNRILEERILQLTQAPERPEPSTRLARLAGATAGLVMAAAMALLFHITPTWAETPVAVAAEPPVQLTPPQVDLPAVPAAPAEQPATPALPAPAAKPQHHVRAHLDDDTRRAMAEEDRQRQREVAQQRREEGLRQREEGQRQREEAQRQREEGQRQRELAQQERERAHELAEQERDRARQQRDAAQEQREAAREAVEEARREALQASRNYAAEVKRQVAEAIKAGESVQGVDMEKVRQEIAQAAAAVHTPEFQAQMAELQSHIQQLHDNMAELREHMKTLNREAEKSVNSPM